MFDLDDLYKIDVDGSFTMNYTTGEELFIDYLSFDSLSTQDVEEFIEACDDCLNELEDEDSDIQLELSGKQCEAIANVLQQARGVVEPLTQCGVDDWASQHGAVESVKEFLLEEHKDFALSNYVDFDQAAADIVDDYTQVEVFGVTFCGV